MGGFVLLPVAVVVGKAQASNRLAVRNVQPKVKSGARDVMESLDAISTTVAEPATNVDAVATLTNPSSALTKQPSIKLDLSSIEVITAS